MNNFYMSNTILIFFSMCHSQDRALKKICNISHLQDTKLYFRNFYMIVIFLFRPAKKTMKIVFHLQFTYSIKTKESLVSKII